MELLNLFGNQIEPATFRNKSISSKDQLLITLRFLATGSFQQVIGDHINIHKSTVSRIVRRVIKCIASLKPRIPGSFGNDLDNINLNKSQALIKEEDLMSMSFDQDKEDSDNNPFDVNQAQAAISSLGNEQRSQFAIVDLDEPTLSAVAQSPTLDVLHLSTIEHEKAESLLPIEESKICSSLQEEFCEPSSLFYQQPTNLSNDVIVKVNTPERVQFPHMDLILSPSTQIEQPLQSHSPISTAQSPIILLPQELDSTLSVALPTEEPTFARPLCSLNDAFIQETTIGMSSFLERSLIPDIASPLSGNEIQFQYVMENVEIKSEMIAPEFPVETATKPSKESKTEDIKNEETQVVSIVAPIVTTITAIAAATAVAKKKPEPKTTVAAKKPLLKPTATTAKPLSKSSVLKPTLLKTALTVTKSKTPTTTSTLFGSTTKTTLSTSKKKLLLNGYASLWSSMMGLVGIINVDFSVIKGFLLEVKVCLSNSGEYGALRFFRYPIADELDEVYL
ncbi:hypothetical protein RN001_006096 [Aquatica leii]|uniref:Nuclease HARBI1 n=1 Tax=Aquatica leii TaxID=1421715 RepID=A0AAN7PCS5_9COLE|nr:hypothetical protein RN001_006096 [Aquatica leii]